MPQQLRFLLVLLATAGACAPASKPAPVAASSATIDTVVFTTTEATRPSFDISPDGRFIVMDLLGQLWRLPAAGGDAVPITNAVRDTAEDFDPAISPDGKRIVFSSDRPGGRGLWLADTSGAAPRLLTKRTVNYFTYLNPAWSPDGKRVAYANGDSLVLISIDDGSERAVRIDSLPPVSWLPAFIARAGMPVWSHDGARLVFVAAASYANRGEGPLWEVAASGGVARPLTTAPAVAPALSPDAEQLAFFARDPSNRWQLHVRDRAGAVRCLTSHAETVTLRVRWAPDGRSLIYAADGGLWRVSPNGGSPVAIPFRARVSFARRRVIPTPVRFPRPGELRPAKGFAAMALSPDGRRLAVIALDSLRVRTLDAGDGAVRAIAPAAEAGDRSLTWSSDGSRVAWTRRDAPGMPFDLVMTDVATGATRRVVSLGQDISSPRWSPDGRWIAFLAAGRLRVLDVRTGTDTATRDLGPASDAWGTLAWSPSSDALVASSFDFNNHTTTVSWIPLAGPRQPVSRFPSAAADLWLSPDGRAIWVEGNTLWSARFAGPKGLESEPAPLSDEPAVEARYANDGSVVYLSSTGLRLRAPNGNVRAVAWPTYRVANAPPAMLIRGARVIDGRGTPLSAPRDVLVEGGRIARVADAGTLRADAAHVVDASGAYLLPGFIDLHAHIWDDLQLPSWLHNGVTTVRDIASQRVKTPDTRNTVAAGMRQGPRIVYGGAMFHRVGRGYSTLGDQLATDSGSLARAVAIIAGLDAGFIKERGFDRWQSAMRLVAEAHRRGITVSGHCEHVLPVVAAGVDGAEHLLDCFRDRYTARGDITSLARAAGLFIVPTAALRYSMLRVLDDPSLLASPEVQPFLLPAYRSLYPTDSVARRNAPTSAAAVERLERSIRRYNEAGVRLATGTDSPFPLGVQHEMEVLVASGLSPMQAIVAATGDAARVLSTPEIGTVAEGQLADLVLLDANPLDDIRNTSRIREVIQGGRVIDRERLRRSGLRAAGR